MTTCKTCPAFDPESRAGARVGRCRYDPPTLVPANGAEYWPRVPSDGWCMKHPERAVQMVARGRPSTPGGPAESDPDIVVVD